MKTFWYKYQRHPFDDPQYFTIQSLTREEANVLAIQHLERLFEARHTVMCECYPCEDPYPRKKGGLRQWFADLFRW